MAGYVGMPKVRLWRTNEWPYATPHFWSFADSLKAPRTPVRWCSGRGRTMSGLRTVQRKLMEDDLVALANDDSMKKKLPRE